MLHKLLGLGGQIPFKIFAYFSVIRNGKGLHTTGSGQAVGSWDECFCAKNFWKTSNPAKDVSF